VHSAGRAFRKEISKRRVNSRLNDDPSVSDHWPFAMSSGRHMGLGARDSEAPGEAREL
jgi:hypothetical protein